MCMCFKQTHTHIREMYPNFTFNIWKNIKRSLVTIKCKLINKVLEKVVRDWNPSLCNKFNYNAVYTTA